MKVWGLLFVASLCFLARGSDDRARDSRFNVVHQLDARRNERRSPRREEVSAGIQPRYEPLFSVGPFFLARVANIPAWSPIVPYTKNATVLYFSLLSFTLGILMGVILTLKLMKRPVAPSVDRSISTEAHVDQHHEEAASQSGSNSGEAEETIFALEDMSKLSLEKAEDDPEEVTSPVRARRDPQAELPIDSACAVGSIKVTRKTGKHSALVRYDRGYEHGLVDSSSLRREMVNLTQAMGAIQTHLAQMAGCTRGIYNNVSDLTGFTRYMAIRKSEKDAWTKATDHMSCGIVIMNISLAISAFLFGRWQDWGLRCDDVFFSWSVHSILAKIWCYIEEPCIFVMGCALWWLTSRIASSSSLLRRREPLSQGLLIVALAFAGFMYAGTVTLLGGSWHITIGLWSIYAFYLVSMLDAAKDIPLQARDAVASLPVNKTAKSPIMSAFVFPVLMGTTPFANSGLLVCLSSYTQMEYITDAIVWLKGQIDDFLNK